jgi:hypothetical protein
MEASREDAVIRWETLLWLVIAGIVVGVARWDTKWFHG